MWRIEYLVVGVALLFILWMVGADHEKALKKCELTMSKAVCLHTLR